VKPHELTLLGGDESPGQQTGKERGDVRGRDVGEILNGDGTRVASPKSAQKGIKEIAWDAEPLSLLENDGVGTQR
jgi:hypothetical protein